jgi:hypothetical protein
VRSLPANKYRSIEVTLISLGRWVKTGNGQNFAEAVGVKEPPMTVEQSVNGVLAQVCLPACRTSGPKLHS